ncbi:MAG: hypothetical protein JNM80_08770 [Phycisphaerae bacterium]|nr:hypothetical protein [Phycisphaerae bacterium]
MRTSRFCALATLPCILFGCADQPVAHGQSDAVLARYRFRRLTADLPASIRVPAVAAAADSALRDRGYSITDARVNDDRADLTAKPFDPTFLESMSVSVRQAATGTRLDIIATPLGDRARSHALLDAILDRLGH